MKKVLFILLLLSLITLGSVLALTYKMYFNPVKVLIIPINPNYNMPITPEPDWSLPQSPNIINV